MLETNLTEIVNQSESLIHYTINGTINETPVNMSLYGAIPPVQVPYMDYIFGMMVVDTVVLMFVLVILFLILIKKGRVTL